MFKIGVMGSVGKTATIEIMKKILKATHLKVSVIQSIKENNTYFDIESYIETLRENSFDIAIIELSFTGLKMHYYDAIKFDMIIYTTGENGIEDQELIEEEKNILEKLEHEDYIIINADELGILKKLKGKKAKVITYGFNPKSSITASSIGEMEISFCIQRSFFSLENKEIEPQEFPIQLQSNHSKNVYSVLSATVAALVNDVKIHEIQKVSL